MDNNIPQNYNYMNNYEYYNDVENYDVNSTRYDLFDYNRMFDGYDRRYDRRFDRRFDRNYNRNMRYYQYPFCDRYGRCENPIWWLFWPLFFM